MIACPAGNLLTSSLDGSDGYVVVQVDVLKDKLVWTKYNEFKTRQDNSQERLEEARGQLDKKREQLDALTQPRTRVALPLVLASAAMAKRQNLMGLRMSIAKPASHLTAVAELVSRC